MKRTYTLEVRLDPATEVELIRRALALEREERIQRREPYSMAGIARTHLVAHAREVLIAHGEDPDTLTPPAESDDAPPASDTADR